MLDGLLCATKDESERCMHCAVHSPEQCIETMRSGALPLSQSIFAQAEPCVLTACRAE